MLGKIFAKKPAGNSEASADDCVGISIVYNMKTNTISLNSKAPTVMLLGIMEQAKQAIMKQQVINEVMNEIVKAAGKAPAIVPATSLHGLPPAPTEKGA